MAAVPSDEEFLAFRQVWECGFRSRVRFRRAGTLGSARGWYCQPRRQIGTERDTYPSKLRECRIGSQSSLLMASGGMPIICCELRLSCRIVLSDPVCG